MAIRNQKGKKKERRRCFTNHVPGEPLLHLRAWNPCPSLIGRMPTARRRHWHSPVASPSRIQEDEEEQVVDHCSTTEAAFSAMLRRPKKAISEKRITTVGNGMRLGHLLRCGWWLERASIGRWILSFAA